VRLDGEEKRLNVLMVFAGNTRLFAGLTRITPKAVDDDGLLDVCIYEGGGRPDILVHTARTLLQRHRKAQRVLYRKAKRLEIDWEEPWPLQLDGDHVGDCPREIEVAPSALWVVVPAGLRTGLFAGPERRSQASELSLTQQKTG
jgi:diacylglycerol kinase family enzyme